MAQRHDGLGETVPAGRAAATEVKAATGEVRPAVARDGGGRGRGDQPAPGRRAVLVAEYGEFGA
jgi:hypothetical protein